jgi:anthranilate synthase component I
VISPSIEDVERLAETSSVIPVYKTILADTETPVSVWMKLYKNETYSFLLESVTGSDTVARYSFLGGKPFLIFKVNGVDWEISGATTKKGSGDPLNELRRIMGSYKVAHVDGLPRFTGGAVGFMSYDTVRLRETIPCKNPKDDPLDDIVFGLYKDLIAFDNKEHRILMISNIFVSENGSVKQGYREAQHAIEQMEAMMKSGKTSPDINIIAEKEPLSNFTKENFVKAVERSKDYITAGDIFQVVLSQRFSIPVKVSDPFDVYRILRVVNPSPYMYYLRIGEPAVIGASPEMLVRIDHGIIQARPIAGTRRRGKNELEDDVLIAELLADEKEKAEHTMLVDLGRNDVGRVSEYGSVRVEEMMHIEKFSHVMHIVSNVEGKLRKDCDAIDGLFACFPAGTLSGAPKIRAMEIIDELEPVRRGLYGGALGYIGYDGNMDTCIVIRTIVYNKGTALIQAGAGIVADSEPAREYQETIDKAGALFTAIRKASEIAGG